MVKEEYKPDTDPWRKKITYFFCLEGSPISESLSQFLVQQCQQLQKIMLKITIKFINCDIFGTPFFVSSTEKQQSHSIGLTVHGVNCHLSVISVTVATYKSLTGMVNLGDKQHMTISTK